MYSLELASVVISVLNASYFLILFIHSSFCTPRLPLFIHLEEDTQLLEEVDVSMQIFPAK